MTEEKELKEKEEIRIQKAQEIEDKANMKEGYKYIFIISILVAFIIFILLLWNYLKYKNQQSLIHNKKLPSYLPIFFIFCLLIQISIGAFVSGLDAGQIYQSWPLMNHSYFPDDSNLKDLFSMKALETPSIVQFIHRNIAYFIILLFIPFFIKLYSPET